MYIKNVVVAESRELAIAFLKAQGLSQERIRETAIVTSAQGMQNFDIKRTKFYRVGGLSRQMQHMLNMYAQRGAEVRYVQSEEAESEAR